MVKRLISANTSEIMEMKADELKQSIKASEGRVVLSEDVVLAEPLIGDITNAEVAASFGADLILLNGMDVLNPQINGLYCDEKKATKANDNEQVIKDLKHLVGRPIGVNLEPVDVHADMLEERLEIPEGRTANETTLKKVEKLGFNFVCLTGNPGTGVTNEQIKEKIKLAKSVFNGLVIAGKMHGAGVNEPVVSLSAINDFIDAGADVILVPAVGTVPEFDQSELKAAVKLAHSKGVLVLSTIGTSQEGSSSSFIEQIAMINKICGVDIQHIGDGGYSGLAPVENIFALSKTLRGQRHTVSRIARSINR